MQFARELPTRDQAAGQDAVNYARLKHGCKLNAEAEVVPTNITLLPYCGGHAVLVCYSRAFITAATIISRLDCRRTRMSLKWLSQRTGTAVTVCRE